MFGRVENETETIVYTEKEPIALVDMDGTLCDYIGALRRDFEKIRSPHEPSVDEVLKEFDDEGKPDYVKEREAMIKNQPDWWLNLEPLTNGLEILRFLNDLDFEIHILTKGPYKTTSAWSQKVEWCRKNIRTDNQGMYGIKDYSITITEDKGLVYGKVLVDDYPAYVSRWLTWRPRGLVVMPAAPVNEGFEHPNVVKYDGTNKEEVRQALKLARNR